MKARLLQKTHVALDNMFPIDLGWSYQSVEYCMFFLMLMVWEQNKKFGEANWMQLPELHLKAYF